MFNTLNDQTASTENTASEATTENTELVEGATATTEATTEAVEVEFIPKSKAEVDAMSEAEKAVYMADLRVYFNALNGVIEDAPSKVNLTELNERKAIIALFDSLKDHKVAMGEGTCEVKVSLKDALVGVKGKLAAGARGDKNTIVFRDHTYKLPTKRANDIKKCMERLVALFNGDPIRGEKKTEGAEGAEGKGDTTPDTAKTEGAEAPTEGAAPEA